MCNKVHEHVQGIEQRGFFIRDSELSPLWLCVPISCVNEVRAGEKD